MTGDSARRDEDGYYWIIGRVDDVINIRGHRIGSEEIETTLLKNKNIVEIAAIAVKDDLEGMCIFIFLNAKKNVTKDIENILISNFGTFALPKKIIYLKELPKTLLSHLMLIIMKMKKKEWMLGI